MGIVLVFSNLVYQCTIKINEFMVTIPLHTH